MCRIRWAQAFFAIDNFVTFPHKISGLSMIIDFHHDHIVHSRWVTIYEPWLISIANRFKSLILMLIGFRVDLSFWAIKTTKMTYCFWKYMFLMENLQSERTIGFLSKGKNRKKSKNGNCRKITSSTVSSRKCLRI